MASLLEWWDSLPFFQFLFVGVSVGILIGAIFLFLVVFLFGDSSGWWPRQDRGRGSSLKMFFGILFLLWSFFAVMVIGFVLIFVLPMLFYQHVVGLSKDNAESAGLLTFFLLIFLLYTGAWIRHKREEKEG